MKEFKSHYRRFGPFRGSWAANRKLPVAVSFLAALVLIFILILPGKLS